MNNYTPETLAKDLIKVNGKERALEIALNNLVIAETQGNYITYFDEADFYVNNNGGYSLSKTQSDEPAQLKAKRVKSNINFYKNLVGIIKRS